jgi:WD40 repeat protein
MRTSLVPPAIRLLRRRAVCAAAVLLAGLFTVLATITWQSSQPPSRRVLCGHHCAIRAAAFSPDGTILATGGGLPEHAGELKLWDVASGIELLTLPGIAGAAEALAFSPDGSWLASAGSDQTIRLWDCAAGREIASLQGHTSSCRSLAFSPDGQTLASASWDQTVRLWEVPAGTVRAVLRAGWSPTLAFSPDGQLVATWDGARDVELWRVAAGLRHTTLQRSAGVPADSSGLANWVLAYGPKGLLLASGASAAHTKDVAVELWDPATRQGGRVWTGDLDWISALAFSADGQFLAAGSWNGTVNFWEAATGRRRATFEGHHDGVTALAISSDGHCLAAGCADKTVILWDWPTRQQH